MRESEERYRAFIESSTEGIWRLELNEPISVDLDVDRQIALAYQFGYLAECNDAMARQYGYSTADQITGARLDELLVRSDPRNEGYIRAFIESNYRLFEAESHEKAADGREIYFLNNLTGIIENGSLVRAWGTQRDITAAKELEKQSAFLASIVRSSDDGIFSKDLNGIITSWNAGAEKIFGYSAAEIIGNPVTFLFPDDDGEGTEADILRKVKNGEKIDFLEDVRQRKDGSLVYVALTISPIKDALGNIIGASNITRDITRLIETRAAADSFRLLSMRTRELIIFIDSETLRIVDANQSAIDHYGFTREQLLTKTIFDLRAPETRDLIEEQFALANRDGTQFETVHIRSDGTRFPVDVSSVGCDIGNRRVIVSMLRDITDRLYAENSLRQNQMVLSMAMRGSHMGVWESDIATDTIMWSEELEAIFGLAPGEFNGTHEHYIDLVYVDDREMLRRSVESAIAENRDYWVEFRFYHSSGEIRWMEGRGEAVYSQKGEPIRLYGVGIDITSRKLSEERLRESEERFSKAFNTSPLILTISSLKDGSLVEVNDTFVEVSGYSREEVIGKTTVELGLWARVDDRSEELYQLNTVGQVRNVEYDFVIRDGSTIIGLLSAEKIEIGGEDFALTVIQDVSERKRSERNNEFILRLGEIIRVSKHPDDMMLNVTEAIGRHLELDRCFFNEIAAENDVAIINWEYRRDEADSGLKGEVSLSSRWAATRTEIEQGNTLVVSDVMTDPRIGPERCEGYTKHNIRAYVAIPLMRGSKWTSTLIVSKSRVRSWNPWEISLLEMAAERTWLALERMRSESILRESEERYRTLADAMPHLVWTSNAEGKIDYYNSLSENYAGIDFDTGEASDSPGIQHPDDAETLESAWKEALADGFLELEYRLRMKNGEYRWHLSRAVAVRDKSGSITRWIGSSTDIHDQKKAQEALLAAERRAAVEYQELLSRIVPLGQTFGTARDLITIYRTILNFVRSSMDCSAFFVSFFDPLTRMRTAAYAWGQNGEVDISQLPPIELTEDGGPNSQAVFTRRPVIVDQYMDVMSRRPHVVIEADGIDPKSSIAVPMIVMGRVTGTIEVQAYSPGAFVQDHIVALEMIANLAAAAIENVRLIEIEAKARQDAEAANQMKDEFLSILSHELRTPLNAMLGWVRMLRTGILDEERSEKALEVIERNTRQQSSLIEDLLDVSRIISGKMRVEKDLIDIGVIAKEVADTMGPIATAKEIEFEVHGLPEPLFMMGDNVRLQQAITNLIQNAFKFTPAKGRVEVTVTREDTIADIVVADNGVGIEAEFIPNIFDRFTQADASTRRNFAGLGLGLTIVRNIVELHGGDISVDSPGKGLGANFRMRLPLADKFYESEPVEKGHMPDIIDDTSLGEM
ncbi:MAG: PAS domain S-box protein [Acidobacteriota bacterium]